MFKTIFKKVYVCNLVDERGIFCGTLAARVWFYVSAYEAYNTLGDSTGAYYMHNFRRVY